MNTLRRDIWLLKYSRDIAALMLQPRYLGRKWGLL